LSILRDGISSFAQATAVTIEIRNVLELFQNLVISQQSIPKGIDACWNQAPVTLELATGKQIPSGACKHMEYVRYNPIGVIQGTSSTKEDTEKRVFSRTG